jgi:cyclopropane fatty-acyl-phospholipid synthase-like methyltransferase
MGSESTNGSGIFRAHASADEVVLKNRELYDETSGPVWDLAVYGALHDGWELINLGGERLLNTLAQRSGLGAGAVVADLCCGQGAACRWLAERCGWRLTGVELNPRQVQRARAALEELEPEVADRIEIIEADVLAWRPERRFDAVFSFDSLMLLPDAAAFLATARASLRPGGLLLVSTLLAGPRTTDRVRRFVWEVDGMITLLTAAELAALAAEAGLEEPVVEDLRDVAVESSETMLEALAAAREEIVAREGEDGYRGWYEGSKVYLDTFRDGRLAYGLLAARGSAG